MKMMCKTANRYGGKKRAFGDEVDVNKHDVRLVTALGWFVPHQERQQTAQAPAQKASAPKMQTRSMATPDIERAPQPPQEDQPPQPAWVGAGAEAPTNPPDADGAKPKRQYQRRDLRAET